MKGNFFRLTKVNKNLSWFVLRKTGNANDNFFKPATGTLSEHLSSFAFVFGYGSLLKQKFMPAFYKVAIVDYHRLLREVLAEVVHTFGYEVILECGDGKSFIEQLDPARLPDICLLDYSMPVMDGFTTAEYLKINFPSVKILMYSIKNDPLLTKKIKSLGIDGFLHKSAELSALRDMMFRLTSGNCSGSDKMNSKCSQSC